MNADVVFFLLKSKDSERAIARKQSHVFFRRLKKAESEHKKVIKM